MFNVISQFPYCINKCPKNKSSSFISMASSTLILTSSFISKASSTLILTSLVTSTSHDTHPRYRTQFHLPQNPCSSVTPHRHSRQISLLILVRSDIQFPFPGETFLYVNGHTEAQNTGL